MLVELVVEGNRVPLSEVPDYILESLREYPYTVSKCACDEGACRQGRSWLVKSRNGMFRDEFPTKKEAYDDSRIANRAVIREVESWLNSLLR